MATAKFTTSSDFLSDFILETYKGVTNAYAAGAGIPIPFPIKTEPRCDGMEHLGGTGENDLPCNDRTVDCPVCGEESGLCWRHLWECEKCGLRMCSVCTEANGWPCKGCQKAGENRQADRRAAANELFGSCKCSDCNGGGDCDWCSFFYGTDEIPELTDMHSSDCAAWVGEPCDCICGGSRNRELEAVQP